ncbi:alpha/beta fold hydrolase [Phreatobacter stygius]|uniref:Alpha/beta hydrolase n=1 Tax=Phreatobacter stygius TaxID=1940610 RepID=A0A4D7B370_9HYPH|nr:alpha/beta hydrolase [Phreatobacter stygius]QCI67331.1 alpha/beta hydrolase [Phreatobacter stygius]
MTIAALTARLAATFADGELPRLGKGLDTVVRFRVGDAAVTITITNGMARFAPAHLEAAIEIAAPPAAWAKVLAVPPEPTFHAFTALALANPAFTITGDPLVVAQGRPVLERLIECLVASPPAAAEPVARDLGQITGVYREIRANGKRYQVFVESAGSGAPVLCLHTAGADARQFQGQLADVDLAGSHHFIAPDLPFHGRSMPPRDWSGGPYRLTKKAYLGFCAAFIEQAIGEPAIIAGGSMGAAMALVLAAERPDLVRGIVAIEPPFRSKGRLNPYQHHVAVHGGLHNASFVRGLMSPTSPLADRRRAAWIYSQGAPGIYAGDLAFYSEEFDGSVTAPMICAARTPVALLCGTYDYSATPEDGAKLALLIPGAKLTIMGGLGHFPMCEHPDLFQPHFAAALAHVRGG